MRLKRQPNRITYILADTTFFEEDMKAAHNLVPTLQSTRFLEDRRQTSRNVDQGLFNTPAMTNSEWKEANYLYRRVAAHNLVPTLQSARFLEHRRQKSRNIDQGLLNTPAMTSNEWKEANYLYTRVAAHGLHHRICATKGFHSPNERCQFTHCGH
jgi:hypothetical protein